jgi:hypothetical protein
MTTPMMPRKRIQVHFEVSTKDSAAELYAAWQEIVSGKRTRLNTAAEDLNEVMERATAGLQKSFWPSRQIQGQGKPGAWRGLSPVSTTAATTRSI